MVGNIYSRGVDAPTGLLIGIVSVLVEPTSPRVHYALQERTSAGSLFFHLLRAPTDPAVNKPALRRGASKGC